MFIRNRPITGSIQPRDGKLFAVINLYVEGKRKQKWIPTGFSERNGKRNAAEFLQRELTRINRERILTPNSLHANTLFVDHLRSWLTTKKDKISYQTYKTYKRMIDSRIRNYFEPLNKTLATLVPSDFESFYSSLAEDGLTSCTILHHHRVMKQALSYGVKNGILLFNIMNKVDTPKDTMYLPATYKREELLNLLDQAKSWDIYLPVLLAAYYGLRRSEVLGLRWSDIDFKDQFIRIEHKILQEHDGEKNILAGYDKLKTQSSRRTLPLIPVVDKALKNAYDDQLKRWSQVQDYVCLNENGQLFNPDYLTNQFRGLLELNSLRRIRFHDLRHTCATLLVLNGIPMKNVQLWLGHSDFRVTARYYAHLDFSAQKLSASTISSLLEPSE